MEKRCLCDRLLCFSIKKIGLFVVFTTFSSMLTLFYIISTENYIVLEIIQLHFNKIVSILTYYNSMFNTRPPGKVNIKLHQPAKIGITNNNSTCV